MKRFFLIFGLFVCPLAAFTTGCNGSKVTKDPPSTEHHAGDGHPEHAHPETGPHQGHLIELGKEDFHLELVDDDASKTVTIYVLDSTATKMVPIDSKSLTVNLVLEGKPTQFLLPAVPDKDDPEGKSSRFQLVDDALIKGIDTQGTKGRVNVIINEKPYSGTIENHAHAEHKK